MGTTHLITDRGRDLVGLPARIQTIIIFNPLPDEMPDLSLVPPGGSIIVAYNWKEIWEIIRKSIKLGPPAFELDYAIEAL